MQYDGSLKNFFKAYDNYESSKKLYFYDPFYVKAKNKIINLWRQYLAHDALEFEFPILVPNKVLEQSQHTKEFGTELFSLENTGLNLRPEAAISVFPHLGQIKQKYLTKGKNSISIAQHGKSFRNEHTTRDRHYRVREFDQMEIEILAKDTTYPEDFFKDYDLRLKEFFKQVGLKIYSRAVEKEKLPHYAVKTIDYFFKDPFTEEEIELGCLSNRSNHDLLRVASLKKGFLIYECSLGLTRITLAHLTQLAYDLQNLATKQK